MGRDSDLSAGAFAAWTPPNGRSVSRFCRSEMGKRFIDSHFGEIKCSPGVAGAYRFDGPINLRQRCLRGKNGGLPEWWNVHDCDFIIEIFMDFGALHISTRLSIARVGNLSGMPVIIAAGAGPQVTLGVEPRAARLGRCSRLLEVAESCPRIYRNSMRRGG